MFISAVCMCVYFKGVGGSINLSALNEKRFVYKNYKLSKNASQEVRVQAHLRLTRYQSCFSLFQSFLSGPTPSLLFPTMLCLPFSPCWANYIYLQNTVCPFCICTFQGNGMVCLVCVLFWNINNLIILFGVCLSVLRNEENSNFPN